MPDGILARLPAPQPVRAFSPTRYTLFLQCPLQAAWSANGVPGLLPGGPAAALGRVIHQLLQEAGEGKFSRGDLKSIEARWDELVSAEESKMVGNWLDRHFLPLQATVRDFEVKRIQVLKRALGITAAATEYAQHKDMTGSGEITSGFELFVASPDGLMRGRIDVLLWSPEGPIIRDYKSGVVFEDETADRVKQEFVVQLQLYAALFEAAHGRWPARLEIVPLNGPAVPITLDKEACADLLRQAVKDLQQVNLTIRRCSHDAERLELILARPSPAICGYCQYRPGCRAYQQSAMAPALPWSRDLFGIFRNLTRLGNGLYMLTVDAMSGLVRVRGLNPKPERHPALSLLQNGNRVAIFDLSPKAENAFTESLYTTIYKTAEA